MLEKDYIKIQSGKSSHYAAKFHNRKTASGELFDLFGVTAAHRKLSFGSIARVINMSNQNTAIVKINDRGPYIRGRIIDLTYRVARNIDALGIANVKIEYFDINMILDVLGNNTENYLLGYSFSKLIILEKNEINLCKKTHNFEGAINILSNFMDKISAFIFTNITSNPREFIIGTIR